MLTPVRQRVGQLDPPVALQARRVWPSKSHSQMGDSLLKPSLRY
jgi:hypothetical protein